MGSRDNLTIKNQTQSLAARRRLTAALEADTLAEAMRVYGGTNTTFWRAAATHGMRDHARTKYADEIKAQRTATLNAARAASTKARSHEHSQADFTEDAEWLARTGENFEGAVRRLGVGTGNALEKRLARYGRLDILHALIRNGGTGYVRAGSIAGPTHGSRL